MERVAHGITNHSEVSQRVIERRLIRENLWPPATKGEGNNKLCMVSPGIELKKHLLQKRSHLRRKNRLTAFSHIFLATDYLRHLLVSQQWLSNLSTSPAYQHRAKIKFVKEFIGD